MFLYLFVFILRRIRFYCAHLVDLTLRRRRQILLHLISIFSCFFLLPFCISRLVHLSCYALCTCVSTHVIPTAAAAAATAANSNVSSCKLHDLRLVARNYILPSVYLDFNHAPLNSHAGTDYTDTFHACMHGPCTCKPKIALSKLRWKSLFCQHSAPSVKI